MTDEEQSLTDWKQLDTDCFLSRPVLTVKISPKTG